MSKEFSKKEIYPSPKDSFSFVLEPISEMKDEALVVLDANVLLLPFTTNIRNVKAIKELYTRLSKSNQLFLPAQAVREYLDNRAIKISDINEALQKKSNQNFNYVGIHPLLEGLAEYKEVIELEESLKSLIKNYQAKIRDTLSAVQAWGWNDPVSKMYHEVLADRILDDGALDFGNIEKDLKRRNDLNIPPGYKDRNKDQNQAGDLVIWHEILNLAKNKCKHLIFVSVDEKTDWWHQSGKTPLYPRFELVDEFREATKGKSFHIVSLSTLLEIFDIDSEVVKSVKITEEEVKSTTDSEIKHSQKQAKASFDPDDEYRKYLNIPIEHGLITNHINWSIKGGYDTDTYLISEVDRAGNIINKYNFFDSTRTTPPFGREFHAEKI
ncbi:PIN-like domain-containing protein [Citrobacter braakii]|uniref:PIN-like domain-containing protein n=1 Tax=Citrobacter braakii TaxID=57706 RepID=UPI0037744722